MTTKHIPYDETPSRAGHRGEAVSALRCSALPLAWICPGSVREDGGVMVSRHFGATDDGTDVHRLLASWPDGSAPPEMVAEMPEDARISYYTAGKMWREHISAWMPGSEAEVELGYDGLTGHIDRISVETGKRKAIILDWKSGRKDISHKHQGFGYAFLALRDAYAVDEVTVIFAWIRTQELESYTVSRQRSEQWNDERWERIAGWDGVYSTGDHCTGCRRQATCPALCRLAKRDAEALGAVGVPDVALMTASQLVDFHRRLKVLGNLLESADEAVRREVRTRGDVEDGDGNVLHFVEENGQREVDALKAWPVLTARLTDEQLAPCLKVRIGEVEKAVAEKAGRGNGAAAKRKLAEELAAVGAVKQPKIEKLKIERKG